MNVQAPSRASKAGDKPKRYFSFDLKNQCWEKSAIVVGRDPSRWRLDPFGNPVLYFLKGCFGPYCHEYDHIRPFSKGGETSLENCQILQTKLNRVKSNRDDITFSELRNLSAGNSFNDFEMDAIEKAVFGDVRRLTPEAQVKYQSGVPLHK